MLTCEHCGAECAYDSGGCTPYHTKTFSIYCHAEPFTSQNIETGAFEANCIDGWHDIRASIKREPEEPRKPRVDHKPAGYYRLEGTKLVYAVEPKGE